jgi:putative adhesin
MKTFDTPNPISATIDVVVGEVRIRAGERADTVVDVQPTDPSNRKDVEIAERTRVEWAGERLLVKAPKLRSWSIRSDGGSIDVLVELPAGSNVQGEAQLGAFDLDGRLGDCRLKTGVGDIRIDEAGTLTLKVGAGDISVERATGHAEVTTGTGDIRVRELAGTAVIKNSNGDTWVGTAGDDVRLNAANGDIAVDETRASVVAKSANGDVRLGEVTRGTVVLETKLGDLEVGIREGTAAWLDVDASAGRVHNALTVAGDPKPSDETVEVRARTSFGDIVVKRP